MMGNEKSQMTTTCYDDELGLINRQGTPIFVLFVCFFFFFLIFMLCVGVYTVECKLGHDLKGRLFFIFYFFFVCYCCCLRRGQISCRRSAY